MRKLFFTFVILLAAGICGHALEWPELDTFAALNATCSPEREKASLKKDAGISLSWQGFSMTAGFGFPDTESLKPDTLRYGAEYSLTLPNTELEIEARAGTLKYSGSLTKLSSPSILAGTAFHSRPESDGIIRAALPSYNSSASPISFSAGMSLPLGGGSIRVDGMADLRGQWASSLSWKCSVPWAKKISLSFTAGSFIHAREPDGAWFSTRALYPEDRYTAAMAEAYISAGAFSSQTSAAFYQDPFGGVRMWFKTLDSFEKKNWSIHGGLLLCDPELITTGGSRPCIRSQFYLNPELSLGPAKKRFRAGLLFYDSLKITGDTLRIPYSVCTVRGDLSYSTEGFGIKGSAYWKYDGENRDSLINSSLLFSYRLGPAGAYSTLTAQIEDGAGTFSLLQRITLVNPVWLSANAKLTLAEKDLLLKNIKLETGLSCSVNLKTLSMHLSASLSSVLVKR